MQIVLIHYRLLQFGGLERRLHNYMEAFHRDGHQVTLLTAYIKPGYVPPPYLNVVLLKPGIHLKPFRQWFFGLKVKRWLTKHSHDFSLSLGRTPGAQLLLCPGNHLGYLAAHPKKWKSISDAMQIKADRFAFKHSGVILAASPKIEAELTLHYGIAKEKIWVVPPPISPSSLQKGKDLSKQKLREAFGLSPEVVYFLFLSTGHANKGLPLLIDWFSKIQDPNRHLFVAGYPPVYPKQKNITGLGYLADPSPWLKAVDFLILPSAYDAFGQVIAEALELQTPVVVSNQTGAAPFIEANEGLVLPLEPSETWIQTISTIHPNQFQVKPDKLKRMGWTLDNHYQKLWEIHKKRPLI